MPADTLKYKGLEEGEILDSRKRYGENLLAEAKRDPWWKLFAKKFNDPVIKILLAAALISAFTGGWFEGCGILLAVILATGIAFLNEYRAGKEFDILNKVDDDIPVKTIRSGHFTQTPRKELVCGDIIFVETGEEIPADAEVLESVNLHVDQSKFTGEPEPVPKMPKEVPAEGESTYPHELLLRGSTVLEGYAYARITAVGVSTEIGKTALDASRETDLETPLQRQLDALGKFIAFVGTGLALLLFVILIVFARLHGTLPGEISAYLDLKTIHTLLGFFMIAVTLLVVAVPEGLAMSVTLSLAYSMRRMLASNCLVRRLHACETIGATTVICTDKTGTLTMNQMRMKELFLPENSRKNTNVHSLIRESMAVNSTANLAENDSGATEALGNPTEGALLLFLKKENLDYRALRAAAPVQRQWTFTTDLKFMATLTEKTLFVKGAPEIILSRCTFFRNGDSLEDLNETTREKLLASFRSAQSDGSRTLAFAMLESPHDPGDTAITDFATGLIYLGFVSIADPVRPEVPEAVEICRKAGIKVKVVTGDTPGTACEIGRQIGLFSRSGKLPESAVIGGRDFQELSDEQTLTVSEELSVIARARPDDKRKLVRALQTQGEVVAVTGDGTNDAPALNFADVGIAMGKTGTAIAREAADIILLDDSFKSIVNGVLWGRSLYLNIQRFLVFQLTINVSAVAIALLGPFIGVEMPLTVIQMLWINLIMDTFAALALATEAPDPELLNKPPRNAKAFIVTRSMWLNIIGTALFYLILFVTLLRYWTKADGGIGARELSIFFSVFVMLQFWNLFNVRCFGSTQSVFRKLSSNPIFAGIACFILVMQILIVQFGGRIFRTVPLTFTEWCVIIGATSIILWAGELLRFIRTLRKKQ